MALADLIQALNNITPLGLTAMLGYIIYLLVSKKGPVKQLGSNHLHDLPVMSQTLTRMEVLLAEIRDGINILRERGR